MFRLICDNSDGIETIQLRALLLPDYKVRFGGSQTDTFYTVLSLFVLYLLFFWGGGRKEIVTL